MRYLRETALFSSAVCCVLLFGTLTYRGQQSQRTVPLAEYDSADVSQPIAVHANGVAAHQGLIRVEKIAAGDEHAGTKQSTDERAIVILTSRSRRVIINATRTGSSFQVQTLMGEVLATNLSVTDLQRLYPDVYETYRSSYAEAWAGSEPIARQR